jgi:hypothetical protein
MIAGKLFISYFIDGITTIGAGVFAEPELHIKNCVVMPFQRVKETIFNEIKM